MYPNLAVNYLFPTNSNNIPLSAIDRSLYLVYKVGCGKWEGGLTSESPSVAESSGAANIAEKEGEKESKEGVH